MQRARAVSGASIASNGADVALTSETYKSPTRLRQESFEAILRQEIGWFDDRANSVGVLNARLSTEANSVRNVCTPLFPSVLGAVA